MAAVIHHPEFDEYWNEFDDIKSTKVTNGDGEELELPKTPDEGEQEAAWLKEAGYNSLVNKYRDGEEMTVDEVEVMTSTLTNSQAAAVRRRVDSLNTTLKKRLKQNAKTDVRDIFPANGQNPTRSGQAQRYEDATDGRWHFQRQSSGKKDKGFVRKGGYAMTGQPERAVPKAECGGVEMLSMGPWGTFNRSWPPPISDRQGHLKVISDHEITFDFRVEENQKNQARVDLDYNSSWMTEDDEFPNFVLAKDKLGITRIDDLSSADLGAVRSLALIELTALFDAHNIIYTRRKGRKLPKESGLFGVSLQSLLENDQKRDPNIRVPLVFQEIIYYLEKYCLDSEGLLRVPGSHARCKQLKHELEDRLYQGRFRWIDITPNDVAGVMKQFLRELPLPLLTHEYLEAFFQVEQIPGRKKQLQALNLLVLLLPDIHRDTLKLLLRFLANVVSHCHQNKMTLGNVSMIMAPNLFLSPAIPAKAKNLKEFHINLATGTCNLMKILIHYHDLLWTVPAFLLKQVRHQNEQEQIRKLKERSKLKIMNRRDRAEFYRKPQILNEADFQEQVIRVHAPHLTQIPMLFQLDDYITAKDILLKFQTKNGVTGVTVTAVNGSRQPFPGHQTKARHPPYVSQIDVKNTMPVDDLCLYEVGGNIGERRLDPNTIMLALYRVNPNAEWIVRKKREQ